MRSPFMWRAWPLLAAGSPRPPARASDFSKPISSKPISPTHFPLDLLKRGQKRVAQIGSSGN